MELDAHDLQKENVTQDVSRHVFNIGMLLIWVHVILPTVHER